MGVLVEAISVIVPATAIARSYPGGLARYQSDAPNATFCTDGHLTRIGFMAPVDVRAFVAALESKGFRFHDEGHFVDIAVVDQMTGPTSRCDWLSAGRHPQGFGIAWLNGTEASPMAAPTGWSLKKSARLKFTPREQIEGNWLWLKRDRMTDVLLDYRTGRETRVERTSAEPLGP
jgi:hypothetical protein